MNADQRPDRVKFVTSGEVSDAEPGAGGAGLVMARTPQSDVPATLEESAFGLMTVIFMVGCALGGLALAAWSMLKAPLP